MLTYFNLLSLQATAGQDHMVVSGMKFCLSFRTLITNDWTSVNSRTKCALWLSQCVIAMLNATCMHFAFHQHVTLLDGYCATSQQIAYICLQALLI